MARFLSRALLAFAFAFGACRDPAAAVSDRAPMASSSSSSPSSRYRVAPDAAPNVILVSMDALRYDRTGLGPRPTALTPNLDALARESVVFHETESAAPWTVPSHMSMWTARYPSRHGMVNKLRTDPVTLATTDASLDPAIETFPDRLRARGYDAAAFTGGAGVSARFGFGRGFETYLDDRRFAGMDYSRPKATAWLRARASSGGKRPFFLFFHGYDVHGQHPLVGLDRARLAPSYRGALDGSIEENAKLREGGLARIHKAGDRASLEGTLTRDDGLFLRAVYDAKVAAADRELGAFVRELRDLGLLERSIVAVVSDHGDEFMEHGHVDHGHTLFEEQLHVVMMVRFPSGAVHEDVRAPVQTVDLFPTLFDALSLAGPADVDGKSLVPLLEGRAASSPTFSESDYRLFVHHRAVREGASKLVLDMGRGEVSLFDLASDPGETHDVAASQPAVRAHLEGLLDGYLRRTGVRRDQFLGVRESQITIF